MQLVLLLYRRHIFFDILLQCEPSDEISDEHRRAVADIIEALESVPVFSRVKEAVCETAGAGGGCGCCWRSCCTTRAHYLAMVILFWPYPESPGCRGARLQALVSRQLETCSVIGCRLLQNEVNQLRSQFQSVLGYVSKCGNCHCNNAA